jgi:hypothetical protein
MTTEISFTLTSPESVQMKMGESEQTLTAADITNLIGTLAGVREQMLPPFPTEAPSGVVHGVRLNPQWATGADEMFGGVLLRIQHAGYGWLSFQIPSDQARKMSIGLLTVTENEAPTPRLN